VSGGGGGGGAGFGGAIFVATGHVLITGSTFSGNRSISGPPGTGGSGASAGQAKGGALFVWQDYTTFSPSQVIVGRSTFQGNSAADAGAAAPCYSRDDADVCGPLIPATPTHLAVGCNAASFYAGVPLACIAGAAAGNLTVFAYTGKVHFTSSDPSALLPPDCTLVQGVCPFYVGLETPGAQTITATDTVNASLTGTSSPINVVYLPSTSLAASPDSGAGTAQVFSFTFSDPDGYQDLDVVNVLIASALDGRNACYLAYSRSMNVLYLVNDASTALSNGLALSGSGSIGNSQCTVASAGSQAAGVSDTLTLTLSLTFSPKFAGNQIVYMAARGAQYNSGWQPEGVWIVPGASPASPAAVTGLLPARAQLLANEWDVGYVPEGITATFMFTDPYSWQDLGVLNILINNFLDGRQACYIAFVPTDAHGFSPNNFFLVNDAGNALVPSVSSGFLSNSQCSFTGSATTIGDIVTVTLNIYFSPSFQGNRVV